MIEVQLDWHEMQQAALVGATRQIEALKQGKEHIAGFDGIGWDIHVEGAAGEMAFAKVRNKYWGGSVNTFKVGGDVGALQIRTRSKHIWDLIVRPGDRDDDTFVLVTGLAPTFRVWGYCTGEFAKQERFIQTYAGRVKAYFVPNSELTPINPRP